MAFNLLGGMGRPLAIPAYRDYSIGNLVSTIGRWAQRVGVGWLVWELTGSEAWLGIVAFADLAPALFVPIIAGAITDRMGSVLIIRVMMVLGGVIAAVLAALTFAGLITVELIVVLVALTGIIESCAGPARIAIVHNVVPRNVSASAIALNTASFNAARLIGPAIAGPMILFSGVTAVFAFNAVSYVIFFAAMLRVESDRQPPAPRTTNLIGEIGEALIEIRKDPGIRYLMVLMALSGFLVRPVMEFLPAFASQAFGGGAGVQATLLSTLGFGAMLSGLWLARRGELRGLTRLVAHCHLFTALACVAFAVLDVLWLALVAFGIYGFFLPICNVGAQTLVQSVVSGHVRARVMSVYMIISFGMPALGALLEGLIATFAGLQLTVAIGAALAAASWVWAIRCAKALEGELERIR